MDSRSYLCERHPERLVLRSSSALRLQAGTQISPSCTSPDHCGVIQKSCISRTHGLLTVEAPLLELLYDWLLIGGSP